MDDRSRLKLETLSLNGKMLVAMPGMGDERFRRSLIYMCKHGEDGAMGIVINHVIPKMRVRDLLVQLDVIRPSEAIALPKMLANAPVLRGGPVEEGRGFVLHSDDFQSENSTQNFVNGVSMTATLDVLKAMARDEGPRLSLLALGYAGWSPGQLEQEIARNGWLTVPADPALIFDSDVKGKYDRALRQFGIEPAMLSAHAGRA